MASVIRKIGNSQGVILPKPALRALGVEEGGAVEFVHEPGKITIIPARRNPREGWEEDFAALAAEGLSEEDREWLEAPLDARFNDEGFTEQEMLKFEAEWATNATKKTDAKTG